MHQQLNVYAVAAGAAGVSLLALAHPAEAKIVYTPTHVNIMGVYNLDLNHDGIADFAISREAGTVYVCGSRRFRRFRFAMLTETPKQGNSTALDRDAPFATALDRGVEVGPKVFFGGEEGFMADVYSGFDPRRRCSFEHLINGYWVNVTNRYLGLKFIIHGKTHYGWARLSAQVGYVDINATLTGYAYETIPGKSIEAGQTKGAADADAWNEEDFDAGASLTNPIHDTSVSASLGALAMGAPGLSIWRREESVAAADEPN